MGLRGVQGQVVTRGQKELARKLWAQGTKIEAIAELLGVTKGELYYWVDRHRREFPKRYQKPPVLSDRMADAIRAMARLGVPIDRISEATDVDAMLIARVLKGDAHG